MLGDMPFGRWLKHRRKQLDLTQEMLAKRVGCATETLRKVEAGRLRPSRQIVERLAEHLQVPPGERATFVHRARMSATVAHHTPATGTPTGQPSALPRRSRLPAALTSFIGRAHDVATIRSLLSGPDARLLTLVGPPGIGKTRLSLQVAQELQDHFVDGVYWVPLAPLRDPALVLLTIAQHLDVPEVAGQALLDSLARALQDRHLLLVIDNFEHVIAAAPSVADLLHAVPRLTVLATSRTPLHIYGEHEYLVQPLAVPDPLLRLPYEQIVEHSSIQLFEARARAVQAEFRVTPELAPTVAAICARLDGLPLAIELIAARVRVLSLQSILVRLGQPLELTGWDAHDRPARHKTLREAIAWSHDLLDDTERAVFRRLAIFAGGCTLEAAAAICGADQTAARVDVEQRTLDVLTSLIEKQLLRHTVEQDGTSRYRMLETIHAFAQECLTTSDEVEMVQRRHAAYYLALAEAAVHGQDPLANRAANGLDEELDNFRAILQWSLTTGEALIGLRLAEVLAGRWAPLGLHEEGRRWLAALLARAPEPTGARASGLNAMAYLALRQGDYAAATALLEESVALARSLGDGRRLARAHLYQGMVAHALDRPEQAMAFYDAALRFLRDINDEASMTGVLRNLADLLYEQHDLKRARVTYEEALAVARRIGHAHDAAYAQRGLGHVARTMGNLPAAAGLYRESLLAFRRIDDRRCIPFCVEGLACLASAAGAAEQAVRLFGAAQALRDAIGVVLPPAERVDHEQGLAAARALLDEHRFVLAWQAGAAMDLEQAVRYALVPLTAAISDRVVAHK